MESYISIETFQAMEDYVAIHSEETTEDLIVDLKKEFDLPEDLEVYCDEEGEIIVSPVFVPVDYYEEYFIEIDEDEEDEDEDGSFHSLVIFK